MSGANTVVKVTAPKDGNASVIRGLGTFNWNGGLLKAQDMSYFPEKVALAEITGPEAGYYTADYMATTRNLTADRIGNLNAILALNHVTAVTLDLGGSSAPVELGQALTVPENKTLTLQNGTLRVGEKDSIVVNGSLVYDNIVNSGSVTVNSGGSVTGAGDFTNNGTVINNSSFISGTGFTNNGTLTNNSGNSDNSNHVRFTNGGTFTNNGTVINNDIFESNAGKIIYNGQSSGSAATFTNNSGAELVNGGTFYNYATLTNNSGSTFTNSGVFNNYNASFIPNPTFWNTGKYTDDTRSNLYLLETDTTTGQVRKFNMVGVNAWEGWTTGTTVTLYGNNTNNTFELSGSDATGFRTVETGKTVTLDLNGRTVDLGSNSLTVYGNLTIKDSTAITADDGSYISGKLTSGNETATVKTEGSGHFTLKSGIIENTYQKKNGDGTVDAGGHAVQGKSFTREGGVLRAMIADVWDALTDDVKRLVQQIGDFFQLVFRTQNS